MTDSVTLNTLLSAKLNFSTLKGSESKLPVLLFLFNRSINRRDRRVSLFFFGHTSTGKLDGVQSLLWMAYRKKHMKVGLFLIRINIYVYLFFCCSRFRVANPTSRSFGPDVIRFGTGFTPHALPEQPSYLTQALTLQWLGKHPAS